jgi:hypothetical protein
MGGGIAVLGLVCPIAKPKAIQKGNDSHQLELFRSNRSRQSGASIPSGNQSIVGSPKPTASAIVPQVPEPLADLHVWHGTIPSGQAFMGNAIKHPLLA